MRPLTTTFNYSTFVNMKQLYSFATLAITLTLFAQASFAQTYSATFTALQSGNWSNNATPVWDATPSNPCNNCHIVINDGVKVTLNTTFMLTGNLPNRGICRRNFSPSCLAD